MKTITVVGLSHHTAPVELREKLSFTESQIREALQFLRRRLPECVILFTCNRTEVYTCSASAEEAQRAVVELFTYFQKLQPAQLQPALYLYRREDAVRHLFQVASGLDSMVVGETQILGQVKDAYGKACAEDTVGKVFHTLFQQAFKAGKRVHRETGINDSASSISYVAVKLAQNKLQSLQGCSVLVVGAGEMSELTLKHLLDSGASSVLVANRTRERARDLASRFQGSVLDFSRLQEGLQEADIVITSTGAPHYVIHASMVREIMENCPGKKFFFVDIAVPRDADPEMSRLDRVYLYDIDDLQEVVNANREEREADARKAERIIKEETDAFMEWHHLSQAEPYIAALRRKGESIYRRELEDALARLQHLSPKERKAVETMGRRIMNQLLKDPVLYLKDTARRRKGGGEEASRYLCRFFNLEDYPEEGARGVEERKKDYHLEKSKAFQRTRQRL